MNCSASTRAQYTYLHVLSSFVCILAVDCGLGRFQSSRLRARLGLLFDYTSESMRFDVEKSLLCQAQGSLQSRYRKDAFLVGARPGDSLWW